MQKNIHRTTLKGSATCDFARGHLSKNFVVWVANGPWLQIARKCLILSRHARNNQITKAFQPALCAGVVKPCTYRLLSPQDIIGESDLNKLKHDIQYSRTTPSGEAWKMHTWIKLTICTTIIFVIQKNPTWGSFIFHTPWNWTVHFWDCWSVPECLDGTNTHCQD